MSDDGIRCAGCRKGATWVRLNREAWLMATEREEGFDRGRYYCPGCQHDTETMRPGLYVLWAVGESLRWARFQPTGAAAS